MNKKTIKDHFNERVEKMIDSIQPKFITLYKSSFTKYLNNTPNLSYDTIVTEKEFGFIIVNFEVNDNTVVQTILPLNNKLFKEDLYPSFILKSPSLIDILFEYIKENKDISFKDAMKYFKTYYANRYIKKDLADIILSTIK